MERGSRLTEPAHDWLSLSEACGVLGVSPSTLRRWADMGLVRTFVTPGGHRRLARSSVEALLPTAPGDRPAMATIGETPGRVSRLVRRAVMAEHVPLPWIDHLDESRREEFRGHGRAIVRALLRALDARDEVERGALLRDGTEACETYGREAATMGIPISVTIGLFLRFRRPFLAELAEAGRRRELGVQATGELMSVATQALDELLVATVRGWEEARGAGGARPAHAGTRRRRPARGRPRLAPPRRARTALGR